MQHQSAGNRAICMPLEHAVKCIFPNLSCALDARSANAIREQFDNASLRDFMMMCPCLRVD